MTPMNYVFPDPKYEPAQALAANAAPSGQETVVCCGSHKRRPPASGEP